MPTYDYVCDACGHKFEERQSFAAAVLTTCPKCGAESLRRLFGTGAAILFKGSGFYETDYRSDSYKTGAKAEDAATKPAGDAKPAGGGDAKPAAGGDAKPAAGGGTAPKSNAPAK